MKPYRWLTRRLYLWGLWLRLVRSLTWGPWGLAAGLGAGLALALVARALPLLMTRTLTVVAILLALTGSAAGVAAPWLRPWTRHRLAWALDRRLKLAERLTTALEIRDGQLRTTPAMAGAQLADTLGAAGRVNIREALPLTLPRRTLLAPALLAAALAVALLLPNPQQGVLLRSAAVRAAIQEQIQDLEEARQVVAEAQGLTESQRQHLLEALEETIAGLDEGRATPEEAVAALAEAERVFAELQDPGAADVRTGLERAAGALGDSQLTRDIGDALGQGAYREAAQALAAYAGTEGEQLTRDEELELARELARAAEAVAQSDPELGQQLAQAAAAIEQGDIARARQAIREAANGMAEAGERVQRQDTVEQTLAALQEGREEVAEAASASPGPGQLLGPGESEAQTGGEPSGAGQQPEPGHHEDTGTGAPYDEVYVPDRFEETGIAVDVGREGDDTPPVGDTPLPLPEGSQPTVPYREVYADYAAHAHAALEGSYIPLGMKRYVRDYFSSLEP